MSDFALPPEARVALVSAAAGMAGPKATNEVIEAQMGRLLRLASGKAMARVERIMSEQTFPAVVVSVDMEETSKRGLVRLRTEPSKRYPDGIEPIRTDPMWAGGRPLFDRAMALCGHKVLAHKAMETKADGTDEKVRILIGLTDLGVEGQEQTGATQQASNTDQRSAAWDYNPAPQLSAPRADSGTARAVGEDRPATESFRASATADPPPPAVPDDTLARWNPNGPAQPKLPEVAVPKGQIPGDKPSDGQLAGIAQVLAKLGYDDDGGRAEVYRLLGLPVPADGALTLKAIPTWYEAAQLLAHFGEERAKALKSRRAS